MDFSTVLFLCTHFKASIALSQIYREGKTFSKQKTISRLHLLSFFPAKYRYIVMSTAALNVKPFV